MTEQPDFVTAARAEAMRRNPPIDRYPDGSTYPRVALREHKRGEFEAAAEWARDHLAAQEPQVTLHREDGKPTTCEVRRGGVLIFAGRDYSPDIQAAQEATDAEVLAALNAQGVIVSPKMHPAPSLDYWGERPAEAMRAALTAAKEARHGD